MKRGILLALLTAIVVVGIYSVKEWMPIMAIAGDSMKPELKRGDAILIGQVLPSEVEVGDVIVFKVHPLIQENYRYPATVAHRVIELTTFQGGLAFKTKGDNTAEDPFVVPASDLRGEVKNSVPYLGYLLLFLQSRQGMIFAITALILLGFDLYTDELGQGKQRLQRGVFAPLIEQNQELTKSQQEASRMTSDALKQFATAMGEYAQHLASHTSTMKDMASTSQELRKAVQEQNQMFKSWQHIGKEEKIQITAATPHVNELTGSFTVKEKPAPPPAEFAVSDLVISPAEVYVGEVVTIGVTVTNVGATEGSYTVVLEINDIKEDEKSVTLGAGQSQRVSFSVSRDVPGSHTVIVDGRSGSLTVLYYTINGHKVTFSKV